MTTLERARAYLARLATFRGRHDSIDQIAALADALEVAERERGALEDAAKTLQRVQFIIGGISGTSADCDEEALRENAEHALALMREKLPPIVAALAPAPTVTDLTHAIAQALIADVNGAYNIIRKAIPGAFGQGKVGVVVHPVGMAPTH